MKHTKITFKNFLAITLIVLTLIPAMNASAVAFTYNNDNGNVTVTTNIGSYFYRIPFNSDGTGATVSGGNIYGYGYGYNGSTGLYSYGYGNGYGYSTFADTGTLWTQGDSGLGMYLGTGGTQTSAVLPVTTGGVATVAVATTLEATGLSGVSIVLPASLQITGTAGWNGSLSSSGTSSFAALSDPIKSPFVPSSPLASVTISTGLSSAVTLNDEMILKLPIANPTLVVIVDGAGTATTLDQCSTSKFTGSTSSETDLLDVTKWNVGANSACFIPGSVTYVGTRHLSTITAGSYYNSSSSSTTTTTPPVTTTESEVEESSEVETEATQEVPAEQAPSEIIAEPTEIAEFTDLVGLPTNDWRYEVVDRMVTASLFKGEENSDGEMVFNGKNTMNRAMAAVVTCRYVSCDLESAIADPFSDVPVSHWYGPSVAALKTMGIIKGKADGTFGPGSSVTRAEFLKMLIEAYMSTHPDVQTQWQSMIAKPSTAFTDVNAEDWYSGYLNLAYVNQFILGYDVDGKREARPNNGLTRYEAAAIFSNFLDTLE